MHRYGLGAHRRARAEAGDGALDGGLTGRWRKGCGRADRHHAREQTAAASDRLVNGLFETSDFFLHHPGGRMAQARGEADGIVGSGAGLIAGFRHGHHRGTRGLLQELPDDVVGNFKQGSGHERTGGGEHHPNQYSDQTTPD